MLLAVALGGRSVLGSVGLPRQRRAASLGDFGVAASSLGFSADGATIVAMVKSRSLIADVAPLGSVTFADVDRIADFEALERDRDLARDLGRVADQLELVAHDVEHAAAS